MKTYRLWFKGRKVGAIGISALSETQVFAENEEAAKLAIYDRFEHISDLQVKEIESPFTSEILVEDIRNTAEHDRLVRRHVEGLRSLLDMVARGQARANAAWHDDPESEDHSLFHSPVEQQFPREIQDAAILDLVQRHLEILNENEAADRKALAL